MPDAPAIVSFSLQDNEPATSHEEFEGSASLIFNEADPLKVEQLRIRLDAPRRRSATARARCLLARASLRRTTDR